MKYCPLCATPLVARQQDGRIRQLCPAKDCGFVFWDNPVPVVAAIVEHEGAVILVRQSQWPEGFHGLVTGFLERDETPERGVLREVKEELDLDGRVVSLVGVYEFIKCNQVLIAYHVIAEGAVTINNELESWKSVAPDKLQPWNSGTGRSVRDWLDQRR
ncbi:NUDIX hydrolase [bacterium]|nr:NUDIX hydrolase [candidate division CSSED10-310 bacterium]